MTSLKGSCVLVTGASSGIGEACARAFAVAGCRVLLVARRLERLEALAAEIRGLGGECNPMALDVRDRTAVDRFAAELDDSWRQVDVLVNNAGLARGLAPIHRGETDDWEEMVDTNLKGLLYVSRAIIPGMVERGRGQVINIGSIAGHESYPGGNVYCATKHGVAALTRGMAMDLLGTGVRVSSVDPGMVETEFSEVRFHGDTKRAASVYEGLRALAAEDVADAVLFCATRPAHASVRELILMPTAQASAVHAYRNEG